MKHDPDLAAITAIQAIDGSAIELLLAEMSEAHDALAAALAAHEQLTCEETSDPNRYTESRWRLSKASLIRRALLGRIHEQLRPLLGAGDAALLDSLIAADQEIVQISSAHIQRWSSASIDRDWNGYRAAAAAICRTMRGEVENEKRRLDPLMVRAAAAA